MEQVSRYGIRPCSAIQAHPAARLWITCALKGIACAQPVGDPVETQILSALRCIWPAKTLHRGCGL